MSVETYICFDYGEKRIGIAVGQTLTESATPLETVRVINTRPDWQKISSIIGQWRPDALIVGMPINMDEKTQEITDMAERFARQLEGRYHLQVHRADERLTTYEARKREQREDNLDHVAAQIILESWLREQGKNNKHGQNSDV